MIKVHPLKIRGQSRPFMSALLISCMGAMEPRCLRLRGGAMAPSGSIVMAGLD